MADDDPYKPYPTPGVWDFQRAEGCKEQQSPKWKEKNYRDGSDALRDKYVMLSCPDHKTNEKTN